MSENQYLRRLAEAVDEVCAGVEIPQMVIATSDVIRLVDEVEALRYALKRIVKSTDGTFAKNHRIDVHVSAIDLAKRTLWPVKP